MYARDSRNRAIEDYVFGLLDVDARLFELIENAREHPDSIVVPHDK